MKINVVFGFFIISVLTVHWWVNDCLPFTSGIPCLNWFSENAQQKVAGFLWAVQLPPNRIQAGGG